MRSTGNVRGRTRAISRSVAAAAGVAGLLAAASGSALAYSGENAASVVVAGPASAPVCGSDVTISATLLGASTDPIANATVTWSMTEDHDSSGDSIVASSTSNGSGVATTTAHFGCVAGQHTITAQADGATGGVVLSIAASRPTDGKLPSTSTLPKQETPGGLPLPVAAVGGAGLLVGVGLTIAATRRRSSSRE